MNISETKNKTPKKISPPKESAAGVYLAYPTTNKMKPIYRGYKTQVNKGHTKVGITTDSFRSRANGYLRTFDGEVKFVPLLEVPIDQLSNVEKIILMEVSSRYSKVGRSREWFDTDDRAAIVKIIEETLNIRLDQTF